MSYDVILFGATGDLAKRYVIDAIQQNIGPDDQLFALGRGTVEGIQEKLADFNHITPVVFDASNPEDYEALRVSIYTKKKPRLFYLSVAPFFFSKILQGLHAVGIVQPGDKVIFEKPFGTSEKEAETLGQLADTIFGAEHVHKIDHYLGKNFVQDAIQYARDVDWRSVASIEINALESLSILDRGAYYDTAGVIQDMIMSHLFQVMIHLLGNDVTQAPLLRQLYLNDFSLGQYDGYLEEVGVAENSHTPTFGSCTFGNSSPYKSHISVTLRSGKSLQEKASCISFFDHVGNELASFSETSKNKNNSYTFLLGEVIQRGSHDFFPSQSSILAAWGHFSPILDASKKNPPHIYQPGSHHDTLGS